MNEEISKRVQNWLDDGADSRAGDEEQTATNRQLSGSTDDDNQQVADAIVVHGLLCELGQADDEREARLVAAALDQIEDQTFTPPATPVSVPVTRNFAWSAIAAAIICVLLGSLFFVFSPKAATASTVLERLIQSVLQLEDRTYRIRVVDGFDPTEMPADLREIPIAPSKRQLEGATLHVRGPNMFVLFQDRNDGQSTVCGCDGSQSWAFKETGAVHVSDDLQRFRNRVPGSQQDLTFVDVPSQLKLLRSGYEIRLEEVLETEPGDGSVAYLSGKISGKKRSREIRGPKEIDIWFDNETGLVKRMFLDGLPLRGGGPRSVLVELVGQQDLGADFFKHESHHDSDRKIKYEGQQ